LEVITAKTLRFGLKSHVLLSFLYPVLFPGLVDPLNTSPRREEREGFPSAKALSGRSATFKFFSKGMKKARGQKAHAEDAEGGF